MEVFVPNFTLAVATGLAIAQAWRTYLRAQQIWCLADLFRDSTGVGLQVERWHTRNMRARHGSAAGNDRGCIAIVHGAADCNSWGIEVHTFAVVWVWPSDIVLVRGTHIDDLRHSSRTQLAGICGHSVLCETTGTMTPLAVQLFCTAVAAMLGQEVNILQLSYHRNKDRNKVSRLCRFQWQRDTKLKSRSTVQQLLLNAKVYGLLQVFQVWLIKLLYSLIFAALQ